MTCNRRIFFGNQLLVCRNPCIPLINHLCLTCNRRIFFGNQLLICRNPRIPLVYHLGLIGNRRILLGDQLLIRRNPRIPLVYHLRLLLDCLIALLIKTLQLVKTLLRVLIFGAVEVEVFIVLEKARCLESVIPVASLREEDAEAAAVRKVKVAVVLLLGLLPVVAGALIDRAVHIVEEDDAVLL